MLKMPKLRKRKSRVKTEGLGYCGVLHHTLFFSIRIYFIWISRLKFGNFKNILWVNLRLKLWKEYNFVRWKIQIQYSDMFLLNYIKLFLFLNGKTSQQTKYSTLAIAKCWMMSGTCNVFVQYKICIMQRHELKMECPILFLAPHFKFGSSAAS